MDRAHLNHKCDHRDWQGKGKAGARTESRTAKLCDHDLDRPPTGRGSRGNYTGSLVLLLLRKQRDTLAPGGRHQPEVRLKL